VFCKRTFTYKWKARVRYILNECIDAGIKEIIFIISKRKMMIKNYFYNDKFYKELIKKKNDTRVIEEYKKILKYRKMIKFVFQD
jgi:UTP--glucose-1-phosphate uridylyltransferase